jgi:hypothetical protein
MLTCVSVHLKAWYAVSVLLWLARMPRPARAGRSRQLRPTLAAAPILFAYAIGPRHKE